jgi:hypothetical protein
MADQHEADWHLESVEEVDDERVRRRLELTPHEYNARSRQRAIERRWSLVRVALTMMALSTFGSLGLGALLIAEGLSRTNNTLAALGVALVIVAALSSGAAAWNFAGAGFEMSRDALPSDSTRLVVRPSEHVLQEAVSAAVGAALRDDERSAPSRPSLPADDAAKRDGP